VYGLRDGLLFRGWLSEETRVSPATLAEETDAVAGQIARYVQLRNRALPLDEDVSLRIAGRDAAWELGGNMLGQAFGRSRQAVRPLTRSAARRLFQVDRPSVVDGATQPWNWFADTAADGGRFLKVGVDTHAFSNEGIPSCDPILDLARAAAAAEAAGVVETDDRLREHYEAGTGSPFGDERWLLYRLAHHLDDYRSLLRQVAAEPQSADDTFARLLALERTMASIYQRYIADLFLSDLVPQRSGPLCAIDVDGVLETRWLSFPALAPAGALALRTLNRHGYRVIVVTGRSLSEVRERCATYRLTGGSTGAVQATADGTDLCLSDRTSPRGSAAATAGDIRLSQSGAHFGGNAGVTVQVANDLPLSLQVNAGAGEFVVDLHDVTVTDARFSVGASNTTIVLPHPTGDVTVRLDGGASNITVEIPADVEARVVVTGGLVSTSSTNPRATKNGGIIETPGYATAKDRVTVNITGGASQITVR